PSTNGSAGGAADREAEIAGAETAPATPASTPRRVSKRPAIRPPICLIPVSSPKVVGTEGKSAGLGDDGSPANSRRPVGANIPSLRGNGGNYNAGIGKTSMARPKTFFLAIAIGPFVVRLVLRWPCRPAADAPRLPPEPAASSSLVAARLPVGPVPGPTFL